MDILVISDTPINVVLAIGLSKEEEKFNKRIQKFKDNNHLYSILRKEIEEFIINSAEIRKDNFIAEQSNIGKLFFVGELKTFIGIKSLMTAYRSRKEYGARQPTLWFRDYTKTFEKQRESDWLCNVCPDASTSFNTFKSINILPYGVVLTINKF